MNLETQNLHTQNLEFQNLDIHESDNDMTLTLELTPLHRNPSHRTAVITTPAIDATIDTIIGTIAPRIAVSMPTTDAVIGDPPALIGDPAALIGDDEDHEPALSSYARCADGNGTLSFLFFSDDDLELARAKAICRTCGLQETCLSGAIDRAEPYGVWGGKLLLEGVPVEFKRGRGRPPKNPKPILVVDEAPIPPHLVA